MDIHYPVGKCVDKRLSDDTHESCQYDQIRLFSFQFISNGCIEYFTCSTIFRIEDKIIDVVLPCSVYCISGGIIRYQDSYLSSKFPCTDSVYDCLKI
jgi:hypothetical protein